MRNRKRVHAHTVGLPEKGTHRELRAFFVRFLAQERASHACVAIVMGLNEVHPSFFDALAADKPPTADQAAWLVHRLEHGVLLRARAASPERVGRGVHVGGGRARVFESSSLPMVFESLYL